MHWFFFWTPFYFVPFYSFCHLSCLSFFLLVLLFTCASFTGKTGEGDPRFCNVISTYTTSSLFDMSFISPFILLSCLTYYWSKMTKFVLGSRRHLKPCHKIMTLSKQMLLQPKSKLPRQPNIIPQSTKPLSDHFYCIYTLPNNGLQQYLLHLLTNVVIKKLPAAFLVGVHSFVSFVAIFYLNSKFSLHNFVLHNLLNPNKYK